LHKKGLYWFTHDLRLQDNAALAKARASCESLILLVVVEPSQFRSGQYQSVSLGGHRWGFLQEAFSDLNNQLMDVNLHLNVLYGRASQVIPALVDELDIDAVFLSEQHGFNERCAVRRLQERLPDIPFHQTPTYTLFAAEQIDQLNLMWPMSFSKFRSKVKKLEVLEAPNHEHWPKGIYRQLTPLNLPTWVPAPKPSQRQFTGGATAAMEHWLAYRESDSIHRYKQTRNAIDDWRSSTKLSPWLNQGSLSVQRVYRSVQNLEQTHGPSPDLEWIRVELLWREFFQWLTRWQQTKLFSFQGLAPTPPLTSFYADRFRKWTHGQTPWRLVNAIMNQLRETGYISNRARQIAASALANELELDWRFGAAWFEEQLIDYDVNVNWGNWQYIAGVGVDSKGGRHFDLEKQTQLFDADGSYQNRWASSFAHSELDTLDAAGWPIAYK
jgi:deoxyribodipyrimidine photo-lyase